MSTKLVTAAEAKALREAAEQPERHADNCDDAHGVCICGGTARRVFAQEAIPRAARRLLATVEAQDAEIVALRRALQAATECPDEDLKSERILLGVPPVNIRFGREKQARLRAEDERDALRAERDRLARVLAVERGDESAAPSGWMRDPHSTVVAYVRPHLGTQFRAAYSGEAGCAWYGWTAAHPGEDVFSDGHASLLSAMEAADAAGKGEGR